MKNGKMIELRIRFWTNDIGEGDQVKPKFAWDSGIVAVPMNERHGIKAQEPVMFKSMASMPLAIETALINAGVTLVNGNQSLKYFSK
jgi:hypothetical protein